MFNGWHDVCVSWWRRFKKLGNKRSLLLVAIFIYLVFYVHFGFINIRNFFDGTVANLIITEILIWTLLLFMLIFYYITYFVLYFCYSTYILLTWTYIYTHYGALQSKKNIISYYGGSIDQSKLLNNLFMLKSHGILIFLIFLAF
jgi:hypothetical protein